MVVITSLLPFKYYFLIDGSVTVVYGYIPFIWHFSYGPEIFQEVLCISWSDSHIVIAVSGPKFPSCHMRMTYFWISQLSVSWFRVALVIAFSNFSLSITFLGSNQPILLTMTRLWLCDCLLCFQNSPRSPLILPSNHLIEKKNLSNWLLD